MKKLITNLTFQVLVAILLGIIVGYYLKSFGPTAQMISKMFISLITMLIAPIIFLTIVLGIAGMDDMKKVGRVGGKALLYFEIVTTFALLIGLTVANLVKPGEGVKAIVTGDISKMETYQKAAAEMKWGDFFTLYRAMCLMHLPEAIFCRYCFLLYYSGMALAGWVMPGNRLLARLTAC